jgi:hypothetical protein
MISPDMTVSAVDSFSASSFDAITVVAVGRSSATIAPLTVSLFHMKQTEPAWWTCGCVSFPKLVSDPGNVMCDCAVAFVGVSPVLLLSTHVVALPATTY